MGVQIEKAGEKRDVLDACYYHVHYVQVSFSSGCRKTMNENETEIVLTLARHTITRESRFTLEVSVGSVG